MSYLLTHPAVLKVMFNHNHPLSSAHALSFRPISPETKELFLELFRKGHTAASAHHWHETKLYLDGCEDQIILDDRAINPTKSDISRLYAQYIARLGLYLHRYDELFNRAKRLPGSDSKTAAIMEVSKLISFCVCL